MVNDWESAFEACPPYGEGKGAYGPEDTALLTEMERTLEKLLPWLEAEGVYLLNEYLEVYRRYARRSSRYYAVRRAFGYETGFRLPVGTLNQAKRNERMFVPEWKSTASR